MSIKTSEFYNSFDLSAMSANEENFFPCPRGPAGPPGPPGPRGFPGSLNNTAISFAYAQLAHLLEQLITLYPTTDVTVYFTSLSPSTVTGKPYQLYTSTSGTFGGIFVVGDASGNVAVPLTAISGIDFGTGSGVVYNPAITFLTKPYFPPGYDTNIITAIHDYAAAMTGTIQIDTNIFVYGQGIVYKNPYGLIVLSDASGNEPAFIPVLQIFAMFPIATGSSKTTGNTASRLNVHSLNDENKIILTETA